MGSSLLYLQHDDIIDIIIVVRLNISLVLVSSLSICADSYITTIKTGSAANEKHLCQKYRVLI